MQHQGNESLKIFLLVITLVWECISRTWICNGVWNCADGSDEANKICTKYIVHKAFCLKLKV